jgi:predicted ATPase/DNA-binding winged helix-turn-helix (wHTH) protein
MAQSAKTSFAFGPFRLLAARHELLAQGVPVAIGQRALDVLLVLVGRHGELVSKDELMSEVWPGVVVEENNLAVHISALRKILGQTDDGKSYLQTVAGRGYRFVAPVTHEELSRTAEPALLAPVPAAPEVIIAHNLPQLLTSLIGRREELATLKEQLESHRLVTLTGAGGIGKTRLAIETGLQALPAYPDGVWLVDLAPIRDGIVAALVSEVLGVGHAGDSLGGLAAAIKAKRLLLILDNCEHVIAESARLAETLIRACPQVAILATSRERLAIAGESVFRVPSLPLPEATDELTAEAARRFGAIEMFVERAAALDGFALTDANAAVVAAICRRIDGIPLAIELAVPRLRVLSERQLARGLDERFGLLTGGSRTAMPRHQTLQALIAWSYELLSPIEQQMLRRFSVFAGATALSSIVAVVAGPDIAAAQVLDLVTSLVEKSLIMADRQHDETRYRLPESTRYFAQDKLAAAHEESRSLHAQHFVARFTRAAQVWETSASEPWVARFGPDVDNLRAALGWAFGPDGSRELGLALAGSSHMIWSELGLMLEHKYWVERARAVVTTETPLIAQARLLSWHSGDVKDADDLTDIDDALRAAALYGELGDAFYQGKMLLRAGAGRLTLESAQDGAQGHQQDATQNGEALLRAARDLLAPSGNTKSLAHCLSALASARLFAGDMSAAQALHGEALAVMRSLAQGSEQRIPA